MGDTSLGENIKRRREEPKLSQEYVAERLGVSRQAVSKWETGQSEPTAGNLVLLAKLLELSLSELVEPESAGPAAPDSPPARRKNVYIEPGYCLVIAVILVIDARVGMGLVGSAIFIAAALVYILYVNPKYTGHKLTR